MASQPPFQRPVTAVLRPLWQTPFAPLPLKRTPAPTPPTHRKQQSGRATGLSLLQSSLVGRRAAVVFRPPGQWQGACSAAPNARIPAEGDRHTTQGRQQGSEARGMRGTRLHRWQREARRGARPFLAHACPAAAAWCTAARARSLGAISEDSRASHTRPRKKWFGRWFGRPSARGLGPYSGGDAEVQSPGDLGMPANRSPAPPQHRRNPPPNPRPPTCAPAKWGTGPAASKDFSGYSCALRNRLFQRGTPRGPRLPLAHAFALRPRGVSTSQCPFAIGAPYLWTLGGFRLPFGRQPPKPPPQRCARIACAAEAPGRLPASDLQGASVHMLAYGTMPWPTSSCSTPILGA